MKYIYIFLVACLASVCVSCSDETLSTTSPTVDEDSIGKVSFSASCATSLVGNVSTRSTYNDEGRFFWSFGDDIAVYNKSGFSHFEMISGAGTHTASFSGLLDKTLDATYALYPFNSKHEIAEKKGETSIMHFLPEVYENYLPGVANFPMYSDIKDVHSGTVSFHMTVGALRFIFSNLPEEAKTITFITDKPIVGAAKVNLEDSSKPYLEEPNGKQYVTYYLSEQIEYQAKMIIDVPIPSGNYSAFAIDIKDKKGNILKSINFIKNLQLEIGHIQPVNIDYGTTNAGISLPVTGLPTLVIITPEKKKITSKEIWMEGALYAMRNADGTIDSFGTMQIKGRGNSTWIHPKKPYGLKLDKKAKILGMPKHKRWVLLANYIDRTLIRNAVAFEIARKCPGLDWTPDGKFVEVILNNKHVGNYYLCQQIKVDENRVNIAELDNSISEGDGITGGFVMELDTYFDEINKFKSSKMNYPWQFKDPDEVNEAQFSYMQNFVNDMEEALYDDEKFKKRDFASYMDLESFVDWWFVHELTGNSEPQWPKSSYMHKDADQGSLVSKIKAGPVWDFDNRTFKSSIGYNVKSALYYTPLFKDPEFVSLVKSRWNMLKPAFEQIPLYIDEQANYISESDLLNHELWPIVDRTSNEDESLTFSDAVAKLKKNYNSKLKWLDNKIKDY